MRPDDFEVGNGQPGFIIKKPQDRRLRLVEPSVGGIVENISGAGLPDNLEALDDRERDGPSAATAAGRPDVLQALELGSAE